jgi:hypothetical protein
MSGAETENSCLQNCPDGMYGDNTTKKCEDCNIRCSLCTTSNNSPCTECKGIYVLDF